MGRPKGCPGGPGRPKAPDESKRAHGKTTISFTHQELRVLNRSLRTEWWREHMRNSNVCRCPKKAPRCSQVHHFLRFSATGTMEHLLASLYHDLQTIDHELSASETPGAVVDLNSVRGKVQEAMKKLPTCVAPFSTDDDLDFSEHREQRKERKRKAEEGEEDGLDGESPEPEPDVMSDPAAAAALEAAVAAATATLVQAQEAVGAVPMADMQDMSAAMPVLVPGLPAMAPIPGPSNATATAGMMQLTQLTGGPADVDTMAAQMLATLHDPQITQMHDPQHTGV